VRHVNYEVRNMRVGDRTDFDKLVFEIKTDGSIEPEVAFKKAVEILNDHVAILMDIEIPEVVEKQKAKSKSKKSKEDGAKE
jgi:DNA-directed RNA polymerase subunit alpha